MPDSQYSDVVTSARVTETTEQPLAPMNEVDTIPPPPLSSSSDQSAINDRSEHISNLLRSPYEGMTAYSLDFNAIVDVPVVNQNLVLPPPGFGNNLVSANAVFIRPPPRVQRPTELAGVTILGEEQQRHHREMLKRTRMLYESLRLHLINGYAGSTHFTASRMMKACGLSLNKDKRIFGSVPGVEIGDVFVYQIDLCVVGLHSHPQAGIDYLTATQSPIGEPIATSVIISESYEDDEDNGDVVDYTGQGGQGEPGKQIQNQKLKRGNLGMLRSMHYGVEIRVIRSVKYQNHNNVRSKIYVYDGLYKIVECCYAPGKSGFKVFKFKLVRMEGQPMMGSVRIKLAQSRIHDPPKDIPFGFFCKDISKEEENVPVYLSNDLDGDREPLIKYKYLSKSMFSPEVFVLGVNNKTSGCDCINICTDDCLCARKNGGEFAYDKDGHLLRGKHVIFECGAACKCGPICKSRVTQKGLRHRLEVFRSEETSWGVKTLDLIEAGSFICEYAGIILSRQQAEIMSMNGDKMVHPCRFTKKWVSWGDLSLVEPDYVRPDYPSLPPLDFQIDVSEKRNVASYISHSKYPNVMVQYVFYDHNNLKFPRVMLFAMETISPSAELTLDYGFPMNRSGSLPSLDAIA